jgi:TolA-binding protein
VAVTSAAARASRADAEVAFARGWSALRANDFEAAADAFGQAASGRDDNALSEDALFWRGAALDRARRLAEAQEALTRFLVRYPRSDRAGEASVMLGWLLLRAGDGTAAEARFGGALGDPSERVRRSARAGLAASGRHHGD